MDNKQKALAAGAAFLLTAGVVAVGTWLYTKDNKAQKSDAQSDQNSGSADLQEESKEDIIIDKSWPGFQDPSFASNLYLSKIEAKSRS